MIRRLIDRRIGLVDGGRRAVRRKVREWRLHRLRRFVPARRVGRRERLVPMHLAELPDAVFLDVLVLVRPFGPDGALAVLTDLDQRAPPALGREAVGRDVHDALQDHVIEELAFLEAFAADDAVVELGDARPAYVDARAAELRRRSRVVGEQGADLAAQLLVDVVAVGALQPFDRLRVLEQRDVALERCELAFERGESRGGVAGLLRAAGARPATRRRASPRRTRLRSRLETSASPLTRLNRRGAPPS